MLGRIDRRQPVGQHGDASAARLQGPAMRRGVDPPGQARDDRDPHSRQPGGQPLGDPRSIRRAMPRSDDGDRELIAGLDRPLAVEQEGRVGDVGERRGILRVVAREDADMCRRQSASSDSASFSWACAIFSASFGPTFGTALSSATSPTAPCRPYRIWPARPARSAARRPGPSSAGPGRACRSSIAVRSGSCTHRHRAGRFGTDQDFETSGAKPESGPLSH